MPPGSNSLYAAMSGLALSDFEAQGKGFNLDRAVPQCETCGNRLLAFMQATCAECQAVVCRRCRSCREAHALKHVQARMDQQAYDIATRNLPKSAIKKLDKMRRKNARDQQRGHVQILADEAGPLPESQAAWNKLADILGMPPPSDPDAPTTPVEEVNHE